MGKGEKIGRGIRGIIGVAADQQHRRAGVVLPQVVSQTIAIQRARHINIADQHINRADTDDQFGGFVGVSGFQYLKFQCGKLFMRQVQVIVVFGQQYQRFAVRRRISFTANGAAFGHGIALVQSPVHQRIFQPCGIHIQRQFAVDLIQHAIFFGNEPRISSTVSLSRLLRSAMCGVNS